MRTLKRIIEVDNRYIVISNSDKNPGYDYVRNFETKDEAEKYAVSLSNKEEN